MRYIYKITCLKNNRFYVGQTNNIDIRFKCHIKGQHTHPEMYKDMLKYGKDNFKIEVLDIIEEDNQKIKRIDNYEIYASNFSESVFIKYYSHVSPELIYNLNDNNCHWLPYSEERRAKLSQTRTGKKLSEETKQKLSQTHAGKVTWIKGKKHSEETKLKISIAKKGKNNPQKNFKCIYCGKETIKTNIVRHHNENCKFKEKYIDKT